MLSKRIFETDFTTALNEELERKNLTVRDLAELTGIPASTLYKVTAGERDPRLSTIKKIVSVLEPGHDRFIAIIAARFLLDNLEVRETDVNGKSFRIRGYSANSLEECIIAAARAEKDGHPGSSAHLSSLPLSRRSWISPSGCSARNSPWSAKRSPRSRKR